MKADGAAKPTRDARPLSDDRNVHNDISHMEGKHSKRYNYLGLVGVVGQTGIRTNQAIRLISSHICGKINRI